MDLMYDYVVTNPSSFKAMVQQPIWGYVMVEEYDSIVCNLFWDVDPRREDTLVVRSHWLYKVNKDAHGSLEEQKATFVAHGFSQVEGIEYDETFDHVET